MAVVMKRCQVCRGLHEVGQCKADGQVDGVLAAPMPAAPVPVQAKAGPDSFLLRLRQLGQ